MGKEECDPAPWTKLFVGNRLAKNDMNLSYIPPEVINGQFVAKLDKSEIVIETEKWRRAMIVYVIGEAHGYNYMGITI